MCQRRRVVLTTSDVLSGFFLLPLLPDCLPASDACLACLLFETMKKKMNFACFSDVSLCCIAVVFGACSGLAVVGSRLFLRGE